jgi:hypothetical protein
VVKAQLEGLSFSVPICVVTEVCHLCTYVDYINRNTLFSSNYMCKYLYYFPWAYLLYMLMDYASLYANISI